MAVYKATSWGRTRRPKNVNGVDSTLHALDNTVYFTENQRFIHIQCGSGATVTDLELYYHASGQWTTFKTGSPLVASSTNAIYEIDGADKVRIQSTGDSASDANRTWLMLSSF